MRVTYEPKTDMGYIYLVDDIPPGGVARNVPVDDGERMLRLVLDYDAEGRLLGIEVFGKEQMHPDLLAVAEIYE